MNKNIENRSMPKENARGPQGLPYKLYTRADEADQIAMADAAAEGRLEEFLYERYGIQSRSVDVPAKKKITDTDLRAFEGKTGSIEFDGLVVEIGVIRARFRYGHIDLRVTPIAGSGERWVERKRVSLS